MSTTLENCEVLLSKEIGDYWDSTTTTAGASGGTTLIDTALKEKVDDWLTDDAHDMITSGTYDGQERKITKFDSDAGYLTVLAHGGQIATSVTYRVHRLFSASEKRRALVHAAKSGFPYIYKYVWDETKAIDSTDLYKEIDISGLGLAKNKPSAIYQSSDKTDDSIAWSILHNYVVDKDGKLWLQEGICGYDLRIIGIGYLDFYDTLSVIGTDWEDTIAIDSPQTEILIAEAALYLCRQMIMPNQSSGTIEKWERALAYWNAELRERQNRFGMSTPPVSAIWSI